MLANVHKVYKRNKDRSDLLDSVVRLHKKYLKTAEVPASSVPEVVPQQ